MPNYNNPFGFRATGLSSGGAVGRSSTIRRTKVAGDAESFARGDLLTQAASGGVGRTFTPGTTPVLAVSDGVYAASFGGIIPTIPVGPADFFMVQSNGDFQLTNIGNNCNAAKGSANATTGVSGDVMNISTVATTNTLDLKIHDALLDLDHVFGNYGIAIVTFNRAAASSLAVGV